MFFEASEHFNKFDQIVTKKGEYKVRPIIGD